MHYIVTLIAAIILNTTDKVLARNALRSGSSPDAYLLVYQLFSLCISIPAAAFAVASGTAIRAPSEASWMLLAILVIATMTAWAGFAVSTFRSTARLELSISATISRTKLLWTALLGVLLFEESLSPLHIAGLAVIFLANVTLRKVPVQLLDPPGIAYALASALSLSLAMALDKWLLIYLDASVVLSIGFIGATLASFSVNRGTKRAHLQLVFWGAAMAALAGTAGYYFLLLSMESGPLSVVVPVYQSAHIVYVLAGLVILKEYTGMRPKLMSAGISTLGIVLIFVGS